MSRFGRLTVGEAIDHMLEGGYLHYVSVRGETWIVRIDLECPDNTIYQYYINEPECVKPATISELKNYYFSYYEV